MVGDLVRRGCGAQDPVPTHPRRRVALQSGKAGGSLLPCSRPRWPARSGRRGAGSTALHHRPVARQRSPPCPSPAASSRPSAPSPAAASEWSTPGNSRRPTAVSHRRGRACGRTQRGDPGMSRRAASTRRNGSARWPVDVRTRRTGRGFCGDCLSSQLAPSGGDGGVLMTILAIDCGPTATAWSMTSLIRRAGTTMAIPVLTD